MKEKPQTSVIQHEDFVSFSWNNLKHFGFSMVCDKDKIAKNE